MKIFAPQPLNEIGKRNNNEDSIYPKKELVTASDRLFVVCDGVGGHNKGEVASLILTEKIPEYFNKNIITYDNRNLIEESLRYAESDMEAYVKKHPECKGMSTTLTMLYFFSNAAWVAWVGDSRIYQVRNGKIIFQSKDHSLVQDLIEHGEITEEEAEHHPQKNVITRAVKGISEPAKIDYVGITDIKIDDYFLLCTDGILETLDKQQIESFFKSKSSVEEVAHRIESNSFGATNDNYSMYLLKVKDVDKGAISVKPFSTLVAASKDGSDRIKNKGLQYSIYTLGLVLLLIVGFFIWKNFDVLKENNPISISSKDNENTDLDTLVKREEGFEADSIAKTGSHNTEEVIVKEEVIEIEGADAQASEEKPADNKEVTTSEGGKPEEVAIDTLKPSQEFLKEQIKDTINNNTPIESTENMKEEAAKKLEPLEDKGDSLQAKKELKKKNDNQIPEEY